MTEQQRTLLIHLGCIALIALCVWLSLQIQGDGELVLELRAALIGSALFLYGKLGFKPAGPILDRILEKLAQRDPARVARITNQPPPPAAAVPSDAPVAPDGTRISLVPLRDDGEDTKP